MLQRFSIFLNLLIVLVTLMVFGCQSTKTSNNLNISGPHRSYYNNLPTDKHLDIHNHLFGGGRGEKNYIKAAEAALEKMDELGIGKMIIMPPPRSKSNRGSFDMNDLMPVIYKYPDRFMMMGGGGTLNMLIHETPYQKPVSSTTKVKFRKKAQELLANGAIGFGEIAIEHFSFSPTHPYESIPADHPLLLLLSDIAAENKVPIDIHMEAIPQNMDLPARRVLTKSGLNPAVLKENISAFERFVSHRPETKIIWSHLGWCNIGERTPALCRTLLDKHPNLYMSFKLSRESVSETRPIGKDKNEIKPEWLQLLKEFPDRFLIGTDQFYTPPGSRGIGPQKTADTKLLLSLMPDNLRQKIGVDNPIRVFGLMSTE